MTASDSFVFRSGENKDEQDRRTTRAKTANSADIVSKVIGLEKQAWQHRSDSKPNDSEMPAEITVNKEQSKGLI